MIESNPDRNKRLYELWRMGYTVDKAAAETGYPHGSVGYYFAKFNRRAKLGKPIEIPHKSTTDYKDSYPQSKGEDPLMSLLSGEAKINLLKRVKGLLKEDKFADAYFALSTFKLLMESDTFKVTQEEMELNQRAWLEYFLGK